MQIDNEVLMEAMSKLSPVQRALIHRVFVEEDDPSEIARDMKLRTQEVNKTIESILKILKIKLKPKPTMKGVKK